jgi:hypothetical protein
VASAATGTALYALLTIIVRYPHTFNYPSKITAENARCTWSNGQMAKWFCDFY